MDHLHERLDALESHVQTLQHQTQTVTRQLRWWRGLACALVGLAILTWALPAGTAQEGASGGGKGLEQRVSALESLLKHFSRKGNEVTITGANLHIVNGLGSTDCTDDQDNPIPDCPNGLGNLIVGYNESRIDFDEEDIRTGSHNVVVGQLHNFSRFGGIVVGQRNTISGDFASVSAGFLNTASGIAASVSGGRGNTASGIAASVSGGSSNTASGVVSSVSGGGSNPFSSEPGNTASGFISSVSGGLQRTAPGDFDWVAGELFQDF